LNDIAFVVHVFFLFFIEDLWGSLIAIVLLAAGGLVVGGVGGFVVGGVGGGLVVGGVGGFVVGGVGDGPLPPGWDPGAASQALPASFLDLITFNPSNIRADTYFCFTSVHVQATCL